MSDDIETTDHTIRYMRKLRDLGELPLDQLAQGLYVALHAEHDLVIRLHERLMGARREISMYPRVINNMNEEA